ncbi:MAG: hydroxymethylpyrimidine/phosphomethylpyrimidine kinase [Coriobacteriaceae bacterium]|nr:hydroxymethylpyrimidine/phosphomethylpyrimidine kinase [Coriobacteriaceae bacterium]
MKILTIAGSDTSSGAGIQADIKTAQDLGMDAMSVVTCAVAETSERVAGSEPLSADNVAAQIRAAFEQARPAAVKIGMLPDVAVIEAVADTLGELLADDVPTPVILDPIVATSSGKVVMDAPSRRCLAGELLPLATVVTPNTEELRILSACSDEAIDGGAVVDEVAAQVKTLLLLGAGSVVLTGGHDETSQDCVDRLFVDADSGELPTERCTCRNRRLPARFHGTGCVFSTALTCFLAAGEPLSDAVGHAADYIHALLERTLSQRQAEGEKEPYLLVHQGGDACVTRDEEG